MKFQKKLWSVLLASTLVLGLTPMTAFAEGEEPILVESAIEMEDETNAENKEEAVAETENNDEAEQEDSEVQAARSRIVKRNYANQASANLTVNGHLLNADTYYVVSGDEITETEKAESGFLYYDSAQNKLILNNLSVSNVTDDFITVSRENLIIEVQGSNTISCTSDKKGGAAIHAESADLILTGAEQGQLKIAMNKSQETRGILAKKLEIKSGSFNISTQTENFDTTKYTTSDARNKDLSTELGIYSPVYCSGDMEISGGTISLDASDAMEHGLYVGGNLTISGDADVTTTSKLDGIRVNGQYVQAGGTVKTTGAAQKISWWFKNANGSSSNNWKYFGNGIHATKAVKVQDGKLEISVKNGTSNGAIGIMSEDVIEISGGTVTAHDIVDTALYSDNGMNLSGGTVNIITAKNKTGLLSNGDIVVESCNLQIMSGGYAIQIKRRSGKSLTINSGDVQLSSDWYNTVYADNSIHIHGGKIDVVNNSGWEKADGYDNLDAGLVAQNIDIDGGVMNVVTKGDWGIWALKSLKLSGDADVTIDSGDAGMAIDAGGIYDEWDAGYDNIIGTTVEPGEFEIISPIKLISPENGVLSPEMGTVVDKEDSKKVISKVHFAPAPADYSKVEEQLDQAGKLDREKYTEESLKAVDDAVAQVIEDKKINEQELVDAMAQAIEDAIKGLVEKIPVVINNTDPLIEVLKDEDKSDITDDVSVKIWLEVTDASETISDASKELINKGINDYKVGQYIDISLYKKLSTESEATLITETKTPISITIAVPESLIKENRTYGIVRNHDGKVEFLKSTYDTKTHALTFETDKFSDYAIVYKDVAAEGTKTEGNKAAGTKTGDTAPIVMWMTFFIMSALAIAGVVTVRRRRY